MSALKPIDVVFDSAEVDTGRAVGTTDNPRFTLLPAIERCVGLSVIYANVPFTYYVIDETNNKFNVTTSGTTTCTVVPGTYNSINLIPQLLLATNGLNLQFFVDLTTSKLVTYYNSTSPFTLDFNVTESIADVLGFDKVAYSSVTTGIYDNADALITNSFVQAPRVVNLSGPSQMFLNSDLGSIIYGKVRNQTGNKSLLGFWPVNSNYQGTIDMVRENPPVIKTSAVNISNLNLSLSIGNRTSYGANSSPYLSLNGEAFQIGIRFWVESDLNTYTSDKVGNAQMTSSNQQRSTVYRDQNNIDRTTVFGKGKPSMKRSRK